MLLKLSKTLLKLFLNIKNKTTITAASNRIPFKV